MTVQTDDKTHFERMLEIGLLRSVASCTQRPPKGKPLPYVRAAMLDIGLKPKTRDTKEALCRDLVAAAAAAHAVGASPSLGDGDDNAGDGASAEPSAGNTDDGGDGARRCDRWRGWHNVGGASCWVDTALMLVLAPGVRNPLRDLLLTPAPTDMPQQTQLRQALRSDWQRILHWQQQQQQQRSRASRQFTCTNVRALIKTLSEQHGMHAMATSPAYDDPDDVVLRLHAILVPEGRFAMCEQTTVYERGSNTVVAHWRRLHREAAPLFRTTLRDYDDAAAARARPARAGARASASSVPPQDLQTLLDIDARFVPTERLATEDGYEKTFQTMLAADTSLDYAVVHLNRQFAQDEPKTTLVAFPRILTMPVARDACTSDEDDDNEDGVETAAMRVGHRRRFELMAVACYAHAHWTVAFRCDGPSTNIGSDTDDDDDDDEDEDDNGAAQYWYYYDDLRPNVRAIATTHEQLLAWDRSKLQRGGTLFFYMHVAVSSRPTTRALRAPHGDGDLSVVADQLSRLRI